MAVHKLIQGGESWLPFALSKLRQLERAGRDAARNWSMPDGAYVHVRIVGGQQFLTIRGGGPRYEFFTSEHVTDTDPYGSPGHVAGLTDTYVCGSITRMERGGRAKALASSTLTPTGLEGAPTWTSWACEDPVPEASGVRTWRSWQNQRFFEYPHYPGHGSDSMLTCVQAQASGWGNTMNWMSGGLQTRLGNTAILTTDIGLDIKPVLYDKDGVRARGAPQLEQPWLWWRRAAVKTVGDRLFFISTDNYGRFQVYPARPHNPDTDDLVPPGEFKTYTPPYPAWVTVPDIAQSQHQLCHWLWKFDKDASRCAAVAFHSDGSPFYKHLTARIAAITPTVLAQLHPDEQAYCVPGREDTPGLVEFAIDIAVTGPGDMDFDVAFTLLRSSYFPDTGRFIFDCDYTLPGVDGVPANTLVSAEIELKTAPGGYIAGPVAPHTEGYTAEHFVHNIKTAQAWVVVNAHADAATLEPTEAQRWSASFPSFVRFLTFEGYRANTGEITPVQSGWGNYKAGIWTQIPKADGSLLPVYPSGLVDWGPRQLDEVREFDTLSGFIASLELRTLSVHHLEVDNATGLSTERLVHGNRQDKSRAGATYAASPVATPTGAPTAAVPVAAVDAYTYALTATLETAWGQGFTVHPAGHWAYGQIGPMGGGWSDIVQAKGQPRTSHRALYNKAFGQDRPYSFYTEPFTGRRLWDQGSFRTAGFWLTF